MLKLIILIILGVAGYFAYQMFVANPFIGEWTFNEKATFEELEDKIPDSQRYKAKRAVRALRGMTYKIEKDKWSMSLKGRTIDSGSYEVTKRTKDCRTIKWNSGKNNFALENETCLVGDQMFVADPLLNFDNVFDRVPAE